MVYQGKSKIVDFYLLDAENLVWIIFLVFLFLDTEYSAEVLECFLLAVYNGVFKDKVHLSVTYKCSIDTDRFTFEEAVQGEFGDDIFCAEECVDRCFC